MSIREVAKKVNISISSAKRLQKELKKDIPPIKYGGPSKVSKVTKRGLARNFELGRLGTLHEGQKFVESTEGVHVDERTVKHYLESKGLKKYLKQKMPDLIDDQMLARLKFAREYVYWRIGGLEDWRIGRV